MIVEQTIDKFKRGDPEKILLYAYGIFLPILISFIISLAITSLFGIYIEKYIEEYWSVPLPSAIVHLFILPLMIILCAIFLGKSEESYRTFLLWAYSISGDGVLLFNYTMGDKRAVEKFRKIVGFEDPNLIKDFAIKSFKDRDERWKQFPIDEFKRYTFLSYLVIFLIGGNVYNLLNTLSLPWPYGPTVIAIALTIALLAGCLRNHIEVLSVYYIHPPIFVSEVEMKDGNIFTGWLRKVTDNDIIIENMDYVDRKFDKMIIPKSEIKVVHNYLVKLDEKIV